MKKLLIAVGMFACVAIFAAPAPAQVRTLYVSVEGQPALYARVVAPYLKKYLPGNPTVIVEVMPGAGGAALCNYLAETAIPDGAAAGIPSGMMSRAIRGDDPTIRCDIRAMPLLAVWPDARMLVAGPSSGISQLGDLGTFVAGGRRPIVGSTSPGGIATVFTQAFFHALGLVPRNIVGYGGSAKSLLALERGEVDFSLPRPAEVSNRGKIIPICMVGGAVDPRTPACEELLRRYKPDADPELLRVLGLVKESIVLSTAVFLPPKTSLKERRGWMGAFARAHADEAFLAEMRKRHLTTEFLNAEPARVRLDAAMQDVQRHPEMLERIEALLAQKK